MAKRGRTPPINIYVEEDPYHVDEMPVPGSGLKTNMCVRREGSSSGPKIADYQKNRPDKYVEPMEAGGKIKGRGINTIAQTKGQNDIFINLHAQENDTQQDRNAGPIDHPFVIIFQYCMVGNGNGQARREQ